jgi:hypothetical protein
MASQYETIRRVRLGDLKRLFRDRYGYTLPDNDAGRGDLEELLYLTVDKNRAHVIDLWAPWMQTIEAEQLVADFRNRPSADMSPEALGQRLRVTHQERERLGLWQIRPCDLNKEELAEYRKAKERARKRRKRQSVPRPVFLAKHSISREKPWEAENISRRTWYRRKAKAETGVSADLKQAGTGMSGVNSSLRRTHLCHVPRRSRKAPLQGGAMQQRKDDRMTLDQDTVVLDPPTILPDGSRVVALTHVENPEFNIRLTLQWTEPAWITPDWDTLSDDDRLAAILAHHKRAPQARVATPCPAR